MAKKKHKTPPDLDHLFSRHVITEDQYRDFWSEYWSGSPSERREWVNFYMKGAAESEPELQLSGTLTKDVREAERQAKAIGGYVARRNSRGEFSKTGRTYQAMKTRRKKHGTK